MTEILSAGGLVRNKDGDYAAVKMDGDKWGLPKGHVERGEEIEEAARREILEETGITQLELVRYIGTIKRVSLSTPGKIKVIHIFLFKTNQMKLNPDPEHSHGAVWVNKENLAEILYYEEDKKFILQEYKEL